MLLQVGGHPGTVQEQGAWVVKQCLRTEAEFYHSMWTEEHPTHVALRAWLPRCVGVADEHGAWLPGWPADPGLLRPAPGAWYVYMENVTAPFEHANVCDVKLGTVLYNEQAQHITREKIARMQDKARTTTSGTLGLRVCGWCVWNAERHAFDQVGKEPGKAARSHADLVEVMAEALAVRHEGRAALVRERLVPRLEALRAALCAIPVQLRSVSVLLVVEGGDAAPQLDVRLVDVAHAYWASTHDVGVELGLGTLIDVCRKVCTL